MVSFGDLECESSNPIKFQVTQGFLWENRPEVTVACGIVASQQHLVPLMPIGELESMYSKMGGFPKMVGFPNNPAVFLLNMI